MAGYCVRVDVPGAAILLSGCYDWGEVVAIAQGESPELGCKCLTIKDRTYHNPEN